MEIIWKLILTIALFGYKKIFLTTGFQNSNFENRFDQFIRAKKY